jgi:hypothetical protein
VLQIVQNQEAAQNLVPDQHLNWAWGMPEFKIFEKFNVVKIE